MTATRGWPSMPTPDAPRRRRTGWVIVGGLLVVLVGASIGWWQLRDTPADKDARGTMAAVTDSSARAPHDTRVRVRVLNASGTRGYARRATLELRDRGFDVVDYDTEQGTGREKTVILSHTGHADWAVRLQRALGTGTIEERADSLRYMDLTVFVGRDWKPATKTLRP